MHKLKPLITAAALLISIHVSAQTYVSGVISTNTNWTPEASPYIITDSLVIGPSAVLTLNGGTVVMFKYHPDPAKKSYMVVNGGIRVFGNNEVPVVFTSERDDSMGDLNGDGKATIPRPGDWGYVRFNSENPGSNEYGLTFTEFRYGGGRNPDTISSAEYYPMVTFRDEFNIFHDNMWVDDCRFRYSKGAGIRMGFANLYRTTISNCMHGIILSSSNGKIRNSTIENNTGYPICFDGLKMMFNYNGDVHECHFIYEFSDNTIRDNGQNYFAIGGNVEVADNQYQSEPLYIRWKNLPVPYLVTSPLRFSYPDNFTGRLSVDLYKGTLVKFKYFPENYKKPYLYLGPGCTLATGTNGLVNDKVIFTSEYDHRYDYEAFTGKHRDPMAGDWGYIEGSDFDLRDCVFKYGGVYANPQTGIVSTDSSAVVRIRAGVTGSSKFSGCLFNSLYRNGVMVLFEPVVDHPVNIDSSSFLLSKSNYGIKTLQSGDASGDIDARNNYWYGRLGPFNPDFNAVGNGCRIDDKIDFRPFLGSSDDELELVSSVVRGTAKNLEGEILPDALIRLTGKKEKTVYSKDDGSYYISNVLPGYGYKMHSFAARHRDTIYENIEVLRDTTHIVDVFLRARTIDYLVDTITFKVNPDISEVQVGGTCYRYYKVIDRITHDPVYAVEVFVEGLVDTFYTNYKGIVTIPVSWDKIGQYQSGKNFYIKKIGIETLEYPPELRMHFRVEVQPRNYTKMWGGKLWLKEGISIVEFKQEAGADIGLAVEDNGSGEEAVNLLLGRGFKAGAGINLGVSAKATLGPIEAGAEAEIGVNLNAYMQDQFIFDYDNISGRMALAKFLVLAGSAFQHLDSPLHRYLGVALLDDNPYIATASFSNSVGLNLNGYGSAEAGIGINLKDSDGKESPIGAELKGSAETEGNLDFLFTSYTHSNQLDFELSYTAEIGLGVSAGVGIDIAKIFGGGDEKDKDDKTKSGDNKKDDDDGFEIEIPDLLSAGADAGIKYGASISTTRSIPEPYTSLGFMYGYKYSAGVEAFSLFGAGVGEDKEFRFTFDFHDSYLKNIVEEKVQLAKDIANADMSNLSLDVSSLSGANIFQSPFATFAAEQTKNAFSFPAVPYNHTVTDLLDEGEFALEISFGLGPVKCKFGAGIEYTEANDYLWKSGVFYNWGLYPLQTYDYIEDNDALAVGPILQDILFKSGEYLWEQIKEQLIPPIFKKIPFWPFNKLKSTAPFVIPVGPDSRTSVLVVDTLSTQDSLFVYYWDWYGTEGISKKKSGLPTADLAILEHVKSMASELHKLDYGIGGFYQFEPNGRVIADSAVLTINYFNEELHVLLRDSSEYTIDEMNLRMYAEDKYNNRWVYIGGQVDTLNNTVTARIDSLGTFTLAPFIPDGEIILTASADTIFVEISNSISVSSSTIYYNIGEVVADGEEFTIEVSKGNINTADSNPEIEGIQVISSGGVISFEYESDSISGIAYLKATSRMGGAAGLISVIIHEENPPEAPVITSVSLDNYSVDLAWNPSPDIDVACYMVYFGTVSGSPYEGTASVFGEPSPVKVGTATSARLDGLYKDSTYYFALRAFDRSGNASDYSGEWMLDTRFNHRPVLYERVFRVEQDLSPGSVVDTLWAYDEDRDQELRFYLAASNTCTSFSVDSVSGEIILLDAWPLGEIDRGNDTCYLQVVVRDNGHISLSDSTVILLIRQSILGMRRAPLPHELRFELYPNPATDELNIELSGPVEAGNLSLTIINLHGQTVWRAGHKGGACTTGNSTAGIGTAGTGTAGTGMIYRVDLSGFPPGLYSVIVQTTKGRGVQRLVLAR